MKRTALAEALLWLPGFGPDEDPLEVLGFSGQHQPAVIIPFLAKAKADKPAKAIWPRLEAATFTDLSGDVTKFEANIAAIDLLHTLWDEKRQPCEDERTLLNRYTGWGGLPQAFNLDQREAAWTARAERLQSVLDADEWESAHASTPNAHYTSLEIIEAMWAMVERLGFKGGRILEPSAGTGYFLGAMPEAIARNSQVTAIELDQISERILKKLYGNFDVQTVQSGFEQRSLPPGHFDLAISNVPFGNYQVAELRNVPYRDFLIHDYFFAKALEVVRPGGLVAFITSSGTMDKFDGRVRQYLGAQADLVAAIRLPNTAFKKIANTEVTTDILILQKPLSGKPAKKGWMEVKELDAASPIHSGGPYLWSRTQIFTNQYFAENPQWVIGKLALRRNGDGHTPPGVFEGDLNAALAEKISLLPEGIYTSSREDLDSGTVVKLSLTERHRPGFRLVEGQIYEIHGSEAVLYRAPQKTLERIKDLVMIRDAARELIQTQTETESEEALTGCREALGLAYDAFVVRHGFIHAKANRQAFRADPDLPLLLSLEHWDESAQTAEKADVFHMRTVGALKRVDRCETAQEALRISIVEQGRVNGSRMGELLGKPGEEVLTELEGEGEVFLDPETGRWETDDAYLSGNVRHKLRIAELAGLRFANNAKALAAVIPPDLAPHEIGARIGSTWIPASDYESFLNETLGGNTSRVEFSAQAGAWNLEAGWGSQTSVAATQTFGTRRVNATALFEQALNQMVPTVYDTSPNDSDKRVVNPKETIAAREKQQQLKERFVEWLWSDDARTQRLVRQYNDQFNSVVLRRYDGAHLELPGFSRMYRLHVHQRDAIWRTVASGTNTLLAHVVGAGKAQPLDAKILTPSGWKKMGDIRVGESVITVDGERTRVTGVFPQGKKLIYKVTFSDGSSTECCDEHLWLTHNYRERSFAQRAQKLGKEWQCGTPKVRSLREIRQSLRSNHLNAVNHSIPLVAPVRFDAQSVPIDPYLLGVLIGDGSISQNAVQITSSDEEIINNCRAVVGDGLEIVKLQAVYMWSVRRKKQVGFGKGREPNPLRASLNSLGLEGSVSYTKFIPDLYKYNSVDARVSLLQGLMDTDGSACRGSVYFYTSSAQLTEDVKFLVQSLGGTVSVTTRLPRYRHNEADRVGALAYSLCIKLPNEIRPFRLDRKASLVKPKTSYLPARYIVDAVPVGEKEAQCIAVDHPSHLYVTDDFIVTHNTLSMICAGMELRRLGKASKPLYVVPNHMLAQFAAEFLRAYPGANILMAGKEDLQGDRRRLLLSRIATGDWDGVLMTHSSFERIKMSDGHMRAYIKEEITLISDAILAAKQDRGNRITKELAKAKKSWEAKLAKLSGKEKKDDILSFEELGIDWLFIDECHLFKNLWKFTKMTRIAGLPNSSSERAFDMFVKTRYVMEKHRGSAGVTFATGTPVSNSMAEMWVMQRYLQPQTLSYNQVGMFDAWAGNFGESVTALELAPDGSGYRMRTRFAKFVNLPELMSMFREVADIRTAEMLNLPVPKAHKETVTAPNTPELKVYVQSLVERAEAIRNGAVEPNEDNMLAVTNDGRKAALDMRLVLGLDDSLDTSETKVNRCARKVQEIWHRTDNVRGTQLVFCDQSTPHSDGRFSVYQDLRHKLVEMGVPAAEIAFIHDHDSDSAKEELFKSVRDGRVRVLLGSTGKMGVGTNVQTRLVALHHLDAPWRPSDVEQREGRIIRQGNLNPEVWIYRYVTEGSFDSYIWQTLETKARFIAQVMQGDTGTRSAEDVELAALSYAEVKALASGNPLVLEKAGVDTELAKLSLLKSQWDQQQWLNRNELANLPNRVRHIRERIGAIEGDLAIRGDVSGDRFTMEVEGVRYRDRTEAGKALVRTLHGVRLGEERVIGQIAGFQVGARASTLKEGGKRLLLLGGSEYEAGRAETPTGFVKVLENTLNRMDRVLEDERAHLGRTEKRLADIGAETARPFDRAERLVWLRQRQREIEIALDLTKGDMAAVEETESEAA